MKKKYIWGLTLIVCFIVVQVFLGIQEGNAWIEFKKQAYILNPVSKSKDFLIQNFGEPTPTGTSFVDSGKPGKVYIYRTGSKFYLFRHFCVVWIDDSGQVVLMDTTGDRDSLYPEGNGFPF
jgi:hypothetical protein